MLSISALFIAPYSKKAAFIKVGCVWAFYLFFVALVLQGILAGYCPSQGEERWNDVFLLFICFPSALYTAVCLGILRFREGVRSVLWLAIFPAIGAGLFALYIPIIIEKIICLFVPS